MKPSHATRLRRFLEREGELFVVERIQAAGGASTTHLESLRATAGETGSTFGEEFGAYVGEQTTKYGDEPDDDSMLMDWGESIAFTAGDTFDETLNAAFLMASATVRAPTSPALGKQKCKTRGAIPTAKKHATKQEAAKQSIRDATGLSFQLDADGCALNFDSRCVPPPSARLAAKSPLCGVLCGLASRLLLAHCAHCKNATRAALCCRSVDDLVAELRAAVGERSGRERAITTKVAGEKRKLGDEASGGALGLADHQTSVDWPAAVQHSDGRSIDDELDLIDGHVIDAEAVKKKPRVAPPAEASAVVAEKEACLAMAEETECGSTKWGATPPLEDEANGIKRHEHAAAAVALCENFCKMVERALPVGALATSKARLYTIEPKLEQITKAFTKQRRGATFHRRPRI
eukprot:3659458-Prymnesium_polylepis.2